MGCGRRLCGGKMWTVVSLLTRPERSLAALVTVVDVGAERACSSSDTHITRQTPAHRSQCAGMNAFI